LSQTSSLGSLQNTGLSGAVIHGVWEGIKNAVDEYIADGESINTELFQIHASIKGVFNGKDDSFDRSRHQIRLCMRPGLLLSNSTAYLKVRKRNIGDRRLL
jgi:hypothetical protein